MVIFRISWKINLNIKMRLLIMSLLAAAAVKVGASEYDGFILKRSQDPYCSEFDYAKGECKSCYTGYFLSVEGTCLKNAPLCASCDKFGRCTACFKKYVLIRGKCYSEGVLERDESKRETSNPLCEKWNQNQCEKCVAGAYMNQEGNCNIEDPNCQKFNYKEQVCEVCMRGYTLEDYRCVRKY